ncbi:MAG TPA: hypothetical protein VHO07_00085 [Streptosporangiaceae bacterium]|nr:hypothetical protein [Streptosporangiaceae bacterium]
MDACRSRNRGELDATQLAEVTVRLDLYAPARLRRGRITGVRDALSGYQDGRCAYCHTEFTDMGTSRVAVDHVLPFVADTPHLAVST